ncbi:MAG TPA: secondary thiamine-phosphate synthase enzyme YjbQ [Bacteroidota bacterium]|nr:secondary thiamine-phosphate synthase enzyme YjbQ [Bacteroidota bacterium]
MVYQEELSFSTKGEGDMHDLTAKVEAIVKQSKIKTGIVHVFAVGSTAGIGTIEFEPGLKKDLPEILNKLIPPGRHYGHEQTWHDGNAHAHLQATLLGPDLSVPVRDGALVVGTWQQIVHVDFDNRPRQRQVVVTVWGE